MTQIFLIVQGLLGALFVLPFALWRAWTGDWIFAVEDMGIVLLLFGFAFYSMSGRYIRLTTMFFGLIYTCGQLAVAMIHGTGAIYWSFPVMASLFFVVRMREAFLIAMLCLFGNTWLALHTASTYEALNFFATNLLVGVYAYIFSTHLKADNLRLFHAATIDPLTKAGNRRAMDDSLAAALLQAQYSPVSVLLIDIDFFKTVNDRFGHGVGDICLARLADHMRALLGPGQHLFRYGGEEFVILMHGDEQEAATLAETIRASVEAAAIIRESKLTVSIGVAQFVEGETAGDVLYRGDSALYEAKKTGRNKVCCDSALGRQPGVLLK